MFAEVPAKDFRRMVKKQATATPNKASLPVLRAMRIQASGSTVRLAVNDLDVVCEVEVAARVFRPGVTTCDARKLKAVVNKLPNGKGEVYRISGGTDEHGNPSLQVEHGDAMFHVPGFPLDEIPRTPGSGSVLGSVKLTPDQLKEWKKRVVPAASTEESRPVLNGVLLRYDGRTLTVCATNGHRLVRWRGECEGFGEWEMLTTRPFWKHLARIFVDERRKHAAIFTALEDDSSAWYTLDAPGVRFDSRGIEGSYPRLEQVYPTWSRVGDEPAMSFVMDSDELDSRAEQVDQVASDDTHRIEFTPRRNGSPDGALVLKASTPDAGGAQVKVGVQIYGEPFRFGFNARYLSSALYAIGAERVRFGGEAPERAFVVTPEEPNGYDVLLMPLRLLD